MIVALSRCWGPAGTERIEVTASRDAAVARRPLLRWTGEVDHTSPPRPEFHPHITRQPAGHEFKQAPIAARDLRVAGHLGLEQQSGIADPREIAFCGN